MNYCYYATAILQSRGFGVTVLVCRRSGVAVSACRRFDHKPNTSSKPYVIYRMVPLSMTLIDP